MVPPFCSLLNWILNGRRDRLHCDIYSAGIESLVRYIPEVKNKMLKEKVMMKPKRCQCVLIGFPYIIFWLQQYG